MDETLYHYCSLDTFQKIIEGGTIRLSQLSLSNDSMEGKLFSDLLTEAAGSTTETGVHKFHLENLLKYASDYRIGLGFCLSTAPDLLSQWRGYGDDGQGVCIGFSKNGLSKLSPPPPQEPLQHPTTIFGEDTFKREEISISMIDIEYDKEEQLKKVDALYATIRPTLVSLLNRHDTSKKGETAAKKKLFETILTAHDSIAFSLKKEGFSAEGEKRLFTCMNPEYDPRLKFHTHRDRITAFLELKITKDKKTDLIKEVIVGPKAHHSTRRQLQLLLSSKEYWETAVKNSKLSYQ